MDQVDSIIISTLNTLGCDLEDGVHSMCQLGVEEVVRGVVLCLRVVCPDTCSHVSYNLPHNMAQRFRAAAAIAQHVKSLGYSGDLGYQSLLYPTEVEVRRMFSFLLERLPQDASQMPQEALGGRGLLLSVAGRRLQAQLARPWLPPHTRRAVLARRTPCEPTELVPLGDTRHLRPHQCHHLLSVGRNKRKTSPATCASKDKPQLLQKPTTLPANPEQKPTTLPPKPQLLQESGSDDPTITPNCDKKGLDAPDSHKNISCVTNSDITSSTMCLTNVIFGVSDTMKASQLLLCSVLAAHALQLERNQRLLPHITRSSLSSVASNDARCSSYKLDLIDKEDNVIQQQLLQVPSPSTDSLFTPLSPLSPIIANLAIEDNNSSTGKDNLEISKQQAYEKENIVELQTSIADCNEKQRQFIETIEQTKGENKKLCEELSAAESREKELQSEAASLQRTLQLLPAAVENKEKLEGVMRSSDAKMTRLREQFEAHVSPLTAQLEDVQHRLTNRESEHDTLAQEVQRLRGERLTLQAEIARLETQVQVLSERLQARGKSTHRSVYTKRILEITTKVQQQRQVTQAVLERVRKVQKEINSLAGKIDRGFAVIEELSYQVSCSHPKATSLYQHVIEIHDNCNAIVSVIRETGALRRKIAELEEQVVLEERRETGEALVKLQQDLAAIKQDNAALRAAARAGAGSTAS